MLFCIGRWPSRTHKRAWRVPDGVWIGFSVKVVADSFQFSGERQGLHGGGVESVGVSFTCLHPALAEKELLGSYDEAMAVEDVTRDEEVRNTCFVFEGEKAVPSGSSRALPADDEAGAGHVLAMRNGVKFGSAER